MKNDLGLSSRDRILVAATKIAQARGYGGLNFRDLADAVGIKAASIYHHFASKADLGTAVARRYWEESASDLDVLWTESVNPVDCLHRYPGTFRKALESGNRICLCSFMAAESDDLPEAVTTEIRKFADVNVAWLCKVVSATSIASVEEHEGRARAIFAAVAGAQLIARSRADVSVYDDLIEGYRSAGLLPARK